MPKQITCPYCNRGILLNVPPYSFSCPNCKNAFRVRGNKTYKDEEIAPEMLCYIVSLFAKVAHFNPEGHTLYRDYFDKFIQTHSLTKKQFVDINSHYENEVKSFFNLKSKYKETIKELRMFIDLIYSKKDMQEQIKAEDNLLYLLYSFAFLTKTIKPEQLEIINCYKHIFEYTETRFEKVINTVNNSSDNSNNEKQSLNVDSIFAKIKETLINKVFKSIRSFSWTVDSIKKAFACKGCFFTPKYNITAFSGL